MVCKTFHLGYVLDMTSAELPVLLSLYAQIAPGELFRLLQRNFGVARRDGIYTARVVIWMMILQRLDKRGTLASAVEQLAQGKLDPLLSRCKRVQENNIAVSTGGYCQARQNLPKMLLRRSMDEILQRLRNRLAEGTPLLGRPVYVVDGSSLQLDAYPELKQGYRPARNPHRQSHWPILLMVVLHDVETGLAQEPCWGPMYGPEAVSEQALAERALEPLPPGAVIIGDRNFGIFRIAHSAHQKDHEVVIRLTDQRAKHLMGAPITEPGNFPVLWKAGQRNRSSQEKLSTATAIQGRLIAWRVGRGKSKQWLYLFTTLTIPPEEVVALYGKRWHIGVSRQGHIVQSVKDRPRPKDSGLVAWEAPWRESKTAEPSDNMLGKEYAQRTRLQRAVNADVGSLHESPVAETVDNARKQQGLSETSPIRQLSPAGYQRRHGVKDDVETGEALGARRRNLVEEMPAITASGKCWHRHQGDGSGRSTDDGRAAKRARREGPGPVSVPSVKVRQG